MVEDAMWGDVDLLARSLNLHMIIHIHFSHVFQNSQMMKGQFTGTPSILSPGRSGHS